MDLEGGLNDDGCTNVNYGARGGGGSGGGSYGDLYQTTV